MIYIKEIEFENFVWKQQPFCPGLSVNVWQFRHVDVGCAIDVQLSPSACLDMDI